MITLEKEGTDTWKHLGALFWRRKYIFAFVVLYDINRKRVKSRSLHVLESEEDGNNAAMVVFAGFWYVAGLTARTVLQERFLSAHTGQSTGAGSELCMISCWWLVL